MMNKMEHGTSWSEAFIPKGETPTPRGNFKLETLNPKL